MNRWHIYDALKNKKLIDINELENIDVNELKEGLIEYFMSLSREQQL